MNNRCAAWGHSGHNLGLAPPLFALDEESPSCHGDNGPVVHTLDHPESTAFPQPHHPVDLGKPAFSPVEAPLYYHDEHFTYKDHYILGGP